MYGLYLAIQIAFHLAYMVIIPLFVFGGLGLWLDKTNGTSPLYLMIGIGLAFAGTIFWIAKQFRRIASSLVKK